MRDNIRKTRKKAKNSLEISIFDFKSKHSHLKDVLTATQSANLNTNSSIISHFFPHCISYCI